MQKDEMRNFLLREVKNGSSEIEAYHGLLQVLGIEDVISRMKEEEAKRKSSEQK